MEKEEIKKLILERFPSDVSEVENKGELALTVKKDKIVGLSSFLKNADTLRFDALMCLTAVDAGDNGFGLVYHLFSMQKRHKLTLKVALDRDNPEIESVSSVWKAADWLEREVFDMFGIKFLNHPDLRRILLPDEWTAYPLRKDFVSDKVTKKPEYA
ncbi:MAG: NADH-quinone oxidoreductase subunit C [Planctomycetes bacterium]|nr:NADH-quinone oxidoreductase subunit C [Planctomycetota bacterium]